MCNIYNINGRVFKFELYNLNYFQDFNPEIISGHYTFWFDRITKKYVFCKHGDYANLVSIRPIEEQPRIPNDKEKEFLDSLVEETTRRGCFYDGEASCNRGPYLLDEIESLFPGGSRGTESYKNKDNEFYTYHGKYNCVFDVHYNQKWKTQDWQDEDNLKEKEKDKFAINLLQSIT